MTQYSVERKESVVRRNRPVRAPDECTLSTRVVNRVASRVDADAVLASDTDLNERMIDATANLLSLARYDVDAYRVWVRDA
ncbi:MAG: hypothetical protein ACYCXT_03975 [Acidiferrobacteraceae bacterium]